MCVIVVVLLNLATGARYVWVAKPMTKRTTPMLGCTVTNRLSTTGRCYGDEYQRYPNFDLGIISFRRYLRGVCLGLCAMLLACSHVAGMTIRIIILLIKKDAQ